MKPKWCGRCDDWKDKSMFNKNATASDGLQSWCTACHVAYHREWRGTHPTTRRARGENEWHIMLTDNRANAESSCVYKAKLDV